MNLKNKDTNRSVAEAKDSSIGILNLLAKVLGSSFLVYALITIIIVMIVSSVVISVFDNKDENYQSVEEYDKKISEIYDKTYQMQKRTIENAYKTGKEKVDALVFDYIESSFNYKLKGVRSDVGNDRTWQYVNYGEDNKLNIGFEISFEDCAKAITSYVDAVITCLNNTNSALDVIESCNNGTCEASNENNFVLNIDEFNKIVNNNKDNLFYISSENFKSDVKMIEIEKIKHIDNEVCRFDFSHETKLTEDKIECVVDKNGECRYKENGDYLTPDDYIASNEDHCNSKIKKLRNFNINSIRVNKVEGKTKSFVYRYSYDFIEKVLVPGGNLIMPVRINTDLFLKTKIDETIKRLNDLIPVSDELNHELEIYKDISSICMNTLSIYDGVVDTSVLGSFMINNSQDLGYFGVSDLSSVFKQFKGQTGGVTHPLVASIWSYVEKLRTMGVINGAPYNCTAFVDAMFYDTYQLSSSTGDGKDKAKRICEKYPDKFVLSSTPAPGSVGSQLKYSHPIYGHTFFVNEVNDLDGDGYVDEIVASEGNVDGNGAIAIGKRYDIKEWYKIHPKGFVDYAVPINHRS